MHIAPKLTNKVTTLTIEMGLHFNYNQASPLRFKKLFYEITFQTKNAKCSLKLRSSVIYLFLISIRLINLLGDEDTTSNFKSLSYVIFVSL
jgi:hypothetical protein